MVEKHQFVSCGNSEFCECKGVCALLSCQRAKEDPIHWTAAERYYGNVPEERREPGSTTKVEGYKDTNPKDAIGVTKPPISTVPMVLVSELGLAWLEGACKYGRHNGRVIGVRASVYIDAMFRHVLAWWECGQNVDPDSGLSHLVKAMACLGMLRDGEIQDNLIDDRPPTTPESHLKYLQEKTAEILKKYPNPVQPYTELNKNETRG